MTVAEMILKKRVNGIYRLLFIYISKIVFLSVYLLLSVSQNAIFAQKDNIWVFNGVLNHKSPSLDFTNEPPSFFNPLYDGTNGVNNLSACSNEGDLLFYNSGSSWIYARNNQKMPHGLLFNDPEDTMTPLDYCIIQIDPNRFLLLSPRSYYTNNKTKRIEILHSSVIDMRLNNGYGDIDTTTAMKIEFITYSKILDVSDFYQVSDYDHWYLLRSDSFFFAFRITNGSISLPVITKVNEIMMNYDQLNTTMLKFSHDGKSVVFSGYNHISDKYVYIYDFDKNTGVISNGRTLDFLTDINFFYRSCVFSPNDSMIFISVLSRKSITPSYVCQFKRYSNDFHKDVYRTNTPAPFKHFGMMKLGTNSRIYCLPILSNGGLGAIQYPDSFGKFKVYQIEKGSRFDDVLELYSTSNTFKRVSFKIYTDTCHNQLILKNFSHPDYFKFNWYVYSDSILTDSFNTENAKMPYVGTGKYYIKIKATDSNGFFAWYSDTVAYSDNYTKLKADFEADTNVWCANVKLSFYNKSTAHIINPIRGESWQWLFGDKDLSNNKNPEHIYTHSGIFPVRLIYSNGYCYDTLEKKNEISIIEAPRPGFKMSQTDYCSPYLLHITDTSLGMVQKYHYDFGDGGSDSSKSPSHFYKNQGNYKIMQILTGPTGCVTKDSATLHLRKGFSGSEEINSLTTMVMDKSILVSWHSNEDAFSYNIFKSLNDTSYQKITNQNDTFYNDMIVKPSDKVYSYKITGLDSCSRPSGESRMLKNILLTGFANENEYSILTWTPYEQWENGVYEYFAEAKDSFGDFQIIASLNSLTYKDDDFLDVSVNEKCYRIKAIEKNGNQQQSVSNIVCLPYQPKIWMPNAFTPNGDGLNDVFKVLAYGIEAYEIKIFNRWGQVVYQSNDKETGWDGRCKGELVPNGIYSFLLNGQSTENENIRIEGTIEVLR